MPARMEVIFGVDIHAAERHQQKKENS